MIISLYSTRIILQGLGQVDYGIYGTVGGAIMMLEALNLALAQSTQRFLNYAQGENNGKEVLIIFNNSVILHLAMAFVVVFILIVLSNPLIDGFLNIPADRIDVAKWVYFFMVISSFFTILMSPFDAAINAHEDFIFYSIVCIIISILKLGAALIISISSTDKLLLYGALITVISAINILILIVYCNRKYYECRPLFKECFHRQTIKRIGVFAGWNFVGATASITGNYGSTLFMNHFFGPLIIGAKNIGDQLCGLLSVLTSNMTKALTPVIVKSEGSGDRNLMLKLTYLSCRFSFLLYLLLVIPFLFNSSLLLQFWLREIPQWAILFCQLQVIRTLFEQWFNPLKTCLMAEGSIRQMNYADLVLGVLTLCSLYVLYTLGYQASWHYYVSIIFLVFVSGVYKLYLCRKKCNIDLKEFFFVVICRSSICLLMILAILFFFNYIFHVQHSIIVLLVSILCVTFVVICIGLKKNERILIFSYISRIYGQHIK